ncbi:SusD/RagB family nutrient-binding outer membrane lipoprotein [Sphingobacterium corticibacter]|uniref:SusD/RagB family nutrient-binding outer membrane lipoprotein n=1 Tax=Sphingobacterium corticibacter TaxID=2171749 RepID=A0A2T8HGI2_9SPHI|nr:SusD/RagB family nutrient-binding outer membrane lipoprotein [Sphingobacterium corticibacter]PVH24535.1 SusD/RagB family nutrient-binding outer membrane lipoprotein [Sphingobacterium corticibacter]
MKRKILYILAACGFSLSACNDFGDVNVDIEAIDADRMDFKLMFTNVQQYAYGTEYEAWRTGLIYISTMLQHTSAVQSYWAGDKYTYNADYNSAYWDRMYPNGVRDAVDLLKNWEGKEEFKTEYQMARILKVVLFHRMTDLYGDVPYTEAGLGAHSSNGYPKYDTQQAIYMDMLNELKEAAEALEGATSSIGSADIIYQGDVVRWQKFAYSLMLRLGMRLSKVDEAAARTWVNTAVSGGLFASNEESALVRHVGAVTANNSAEPFGKIYVHEDPNAYRMSKFFIDMLRNTSDPRLSFLATVVKDPTIKVDAQGFSRGDTTAAKQLGMPNGYDQLGGATDISNSPGYPDPQRLTKDSLNFYSVANRYTYGRIDAPTFLVTHAENQLLLAEAAYRGWIAGSAKTYYDAGVTAAMKQFAQFNIAGISDGAIRAYLTANPFNEATALEQINTQYYINTFSDEYESFANWRRSGFPVLTPVQYIGNVTNGTIPRRFTYPVAESTVNMANYQEAVGRLNNGDVMTSRVWWDTAN